MPDGRSETERNPRGILTINTGSSSLKATLYEGANGEKPIFSAEAERIGLPHGHFQVQNGKGASLLDQTRVLPDHEAALRALLDWMPRGGHTEPPAAIGHRIVHGGRDYSKPEVVTPELVGALRRLVPIDPMHLPQALEAIRILQEAFPEVPQIACFDTAFHRTMPRVAQIYPLPSRFEEIGVIRYGFHGLSYEYIMSELARIDAGAAEGRVIIAHLGNGASMAAVRQGKSLDTTMGFTPTGGLVMGTRSGDLDPGVLVYLGEEQGMSPEEINRLVNGQAGLLGVSGSSADMSDLLERASADSRAAEAVELFCYSARKFLGALAAALGGLDTLIFTGGIGEHAAPVRAGICAGLGFLGIHLEQDRNAKSAPIISREDSVVTVRVIPTDEDLMIARHVVGVLKSGGTGVPV